MDSSQSLRQTYNNQKRLAFEEERSVPSTLDTTPLTNSYWFLASILLGALVGGIILAPIITMYIKQDVPTTTSTTSTSTSTTSTATTSTTTTTVTTLPLVPSGVILLWSGTIATVPQDWAICDGTQGTPDLRDRFILGSGSNAQYSPTQTGGSSSQTATITVGDTTLTTAQMPSHSHGGSTSIEDSPTIYYDVNSVPCTSGNF
ncbi:unnamed protein product [Adineta steineri]|uniref:Uncharacterized protein n=1 Tax=Adineta steineri TaxID=433720 RepID=A0A818KGY9_9BILA|nr:unnamed protein product [Adineta steineri]CAF3551533.1 unnamed protein product [Adineta steineri]